METKEVHRYVLFPLEVKQSGQIIQLDLKLPAHITECKGILATVKGYLNVPKDIPRIGEISISLNSGQVHPLHYTVGYSREPLHKKEPFLTIEEPIVPNLRISGYYEDRGTSLDALGAFQPYQLNLYFDCKATD